MERYCPPWTTRFVPANKISPKFKRVHESFLSSKLFSAKVRRFFRDFSVFIGPENGKIESVNENENKGNKTVDDFFKKYVLQQKPANTKVHICYLPA